jgi:glycerol uptake facilitator-like aquaporin
VRLDTASAVSKTWNAEMSRLFFTVMLVVTILAVTPWDYVWKRYVLAPGGPSR